MEQSCEVREKEREGNRMLLKSKVNKDGASRIPVAKAEYISFFKIDWYSHANIIPSVNECHAVYV